MSEEAAGPPAPRGHRGQHRREEHHEEAVRGPSLRERLEGRQLRNMLSTPEQRPAVPPKVNMAYGLARLVR